MGIAKQHLLKPKVFIASAGENLDVARAVQRNLHKEFETTVWDQNAVNKISTYPMDSLVAQLKANHFGIFVATPVDLVKSRNRRARAPRDNIILELGVFIGGLGLERVFVVVPDPIEQVKLPSDLGPLTLAGYDPARTDRDLVRALGPACDEIRNSIREKLHIVFEESSQLGNVGVFSRHQSQFGPLIESTRTLRLFFIHSRRWREENIEHIRSFLARDNSRLVVYLPNIENKLLMSSLTRHFDDGPVIPSLIADAYQVFSDLATSFKGRVRIREFNLYPTYSFYEFDDRIIVALYPLSSFKADVPTVEVLKGSALFRFFAADIDKLKRSTKALPRKTAKTRVARPARRTRSHTL